MGYWISLNFNVLNLIASILQNLNFKIQILPWNKFKICVGVGVGFEISMTSISYTEKFKYFSSPSSVFKILLIKIIYSIFSALSNQILVTNMTNALLIPKAAKRVFLYPFGKKFLTKMMFWTYSKIMTRNMYLGKEESGLKSPILKWFFFQCGPPLRSKFFPKLGF